MLEEEVQHHDPRNIPAAPDIHVSNNNNVKINNDTFDEIPIINMIMIDDIVEVPASPPRQPDSSTATTPDTKYVVPHEVQLQEPTSSVSSQLSPAPPTILASPAAPPAVINIAAPKARQSSPQAHTPTVSYLTQNSHFVKFFLKFTIF